MEIPFLFIVQITDIIDLLLDFGSVQFVSGIDDIGFYLSDNGYYILWIKYLTAKIKSMIFREIK